MNLNAVRPRRPRALCTRASSKQADRHAQVAHEEPKRHMFASTLYDKGMCALQISGTSSKPLQHHVMVARAASCHGSACSMLGWWRRVLISCWSPAADRAGGPRDREHGGRGELLLHVPGWQHVQGAGGVRALLLPAGPGAWARHQLIGPLTSDCLPAKRAALSMVMLSTLSFWWTFDVRESLREEHVQAFLHGHSHYRSTTLHRKHSTSGSMRRSWLGDSTDTRHACSG